MVIQKSLAHLLSQLDTDYLNNRITINLWIVDVA